MSKVLVVLGLGLAVAGCKDHRPRTKAQRAGDALSRVASVERDLAEVRGLDFTAAVPASYQSAADFRAYMQRQVANAPHIDDTSVALVALGLLPPSADLGHAVEDAYSTAATMTSSSRR